MGSGRVKQWLDNVCIVDGISGTKFKRMKKKQGKSVGKIKKQKSEKGKVKQLDKEQPDDSPDFGGLPARDLKKNLGCG